MAKFTLRHYCCGKKIFYRTYPFKSRTKCHVSYGCQNPTRQEKAKFPPWCVTRTVGVLNRVSSLGKHFSAALLLWRKILLSHLPFFKSRAKCHVSRATLDSRPRGALMLKLTPLSPLLKVVRCAVRTRCVVPQWCKERDESPRIPQRRAEGRAGAQTLDFGRLEPSGRHARSRENARCVI